MTDLPEWSLRSEAVTTSFESDVAAEAVVLRSNEPRRVNWAKEIGLPTTNEAEAVASLNHAQMALRLVEGFIDPQRAEHAALEDADPDSYRSLLSGRLASLCGQSQAALENSLKALVHLRGLESPGRIHKLEQLLPKLSADMRKDVDTLLADIALEDASLWRPRDTCPADFPEIPLAEHAPLAFRMLTAAAALTGYTADRIAPAAADGAPEPAPPSGTAARPAATERTANLARQAATGVALALTGWDIDANNPTAIMGCPPLPEPPDAAH